MPVHRCPQCAIPYVEEEVENGACPVCNAALAVAPVTPPPPQTTPSAPRRAVPFLLGLLVGCLIGVAARKTVRQVVYTARVLEFSQFTH